MVDGGVYSVKLCTQIGLAVGDTQKVEEKATLTYLSLQVKCSYIHTYMYHCHNVAYHSH